MSLLSIVLTLFSSFALADVSQMEAGRATVARMQGCYLIDYSYVETESLKQGYAVDRRVYDVNKNRSFKEWIYMEDISPTHVRLQHVLFAVDLNGKLMEGTELRHQAEDWQFNAPYLYDFVSPGKWQVVNLSLTPNAWTRRITFLDDGPRYQCASTWNMTTENPEWSCANSSPIPGRETRDMQRKDYNVLDRFTRLMIYSGSWLERQENTKVIYNAQDGSRTPLAKELGKNWYVRLPDSECLPAQVFVGPRRAFWNLLREAWAEVLDGKSAFNEKPSTDGTSRYGTILDLEEKYLQADFASPFVREQIKQEILATIQKYRQ